MKKVSRTLIGFIVISLFYCLLLGMGCIVQACGFCQKEPAVIAGCLGILMLISAGTITTIAYLAGASIMGDNI